jgi:predicted deacylase
VGPTCTQQLTLFPSISEVSSSSTGFDVKKENIIKLGNLQILSTKTCFSAKQAPMIGDIKVSVAPFGGWFARKTFKLSVPKPPLIETSALEQPISASKALAIDFSSDDIVFDYQLKIDNKSVPCSMKNSQVSCDIVPLNLQQGKDYTMELLRMFDGRNVNIVVNKVIRTITATNVVSASVNQGQIVFDKPKTFTIGFDKVVVKGVIMLEKIEGAKHTVVDTSTLFNGKQAVITSKNDLDRDVSYALSVNQIEAVDGSTLVSPYISDFKLSDGPIITSVNVGKTGIPQTKTIILTFNQPLSGDQDISQYVSAAGTSTTISRSNNKVLISYSNAPICTDIKIHINGGLLSNYGVVQNHSWSFTARTICHTISAIGHSKNGRSILAYTFGSGSQVILYVGSIHGNELSAKYLMNAWVNELEANARDIPSNKKIIVIPSLNPDGNSANSRNNADNVDLNRNFPADDWQTDIVSPDNQPIPGGGGPNPLSEPESQAIAAYTIQLRPSLTMSFHSAAGYAISNQAGNSASLAASYARLARYSNMTGNGSAFSYSITGTYDDWLREDYGLASIVVELSSNSSSEFSRNKAALWAMARS